MGDIFDEVQSTRDMADVRERLSLILEISKFWCCRRKKSDKRFIHDVTNDRLEQQEQDDTWEGKVKVLQNCFDTYGIEQAKRMEEQTKKMDKLLNQNEENAEEQNAKIAELSERVDQLLELMSKSSS